MIDPDKASRGLSRLLRENPVAVIALSVLGAVVYLLSARPELAPVFGAMFTQDAVLALSVMAAVIFAFLSLKQQREGDLKRIGELERMADDNDLETQICRKEQSAMRTAVFKLATLTIDSSRRDEMLGIVDALDKAVTQARLEFKPRFGPPRDGGLRADDPREQE